MTTRPSRLAVAATCIAVVASGCTTSRTAGPAGVPVSARGGLDAAIARCVATVAGGAVLGAVIGAATGGGRRVAEGVVMGAAVGGAACIVLSALDEQDKQRIRAAQIAAASSNKPRYLVYSGTDGRRREITIRPKVAAVPAPRGDRLCRPVDTSATIQGSGTAELPTQIVCRTPRAIGCRPDRSLAAKCSSRRRSLFRTRHIV